MSPSGTFSKYISKSFLRNSKYIGPLMVRSKNVVQSFDRYKCQPICGGSNDVDLAARNTHVDFMVTNNGNYAY